MEKLIKSKVLQTQYLSSRKWGLLDREEVREVEYKNFMKDLASLQ